MDTSPRYPLGPPTNRQDKPLLRALRGRPGWFVDTKGVEHFIDPLAKPKTAGST